MMSRFKKCVFMQFSTDNHVEPLSDIIDNEKDAAPNGNWSLKTQRRMTVIGAERRYWRRKTHGIVLLMLIEMDIES